MRWRAFFVCWLLAGPAFAIDPEPAFADPEVDAVYRELINEVRCLVCQNQTIADSTAGLAGDLRREIRQMLEEGATRADVEDFLLARYGDFVLYRPPLRPGTWILWGAPLILLCIGGVVFARVIRSRMNQPITEDDLAEDDLA